MSFDYSGLSVITRAFKMLGITETLTDDQVAEGLDSLNRMSNSLQAEDIYKWKITQEFISLTDSSEVVVDGVNYRCIKSHTSTAASEPGTGTLWPVYWVSAGTEGIAWVLSTPYVSSNSISFDTGVIDVLNVVLRTTEGRDSDLIKIGLQEYTEIIDKWVTGLPTHIYISKTGIVPLVQGLLYPHPTDTTNVLVANILSNISEGDDSSDAIDYTRASYHLLVLATAFDLSLIYQPEVASQLERLLDKEIKRQRKSTILTQTEDSCQIEGI